MKAMRKTLLPIIALGLLAGCTGTRLGLLEDEGQPGKVGKVAAINELTGEDIAVVEDANTVSRIGRNKVSITQLDPAKMKARYGELFANMPLPPKPFTLYFKTGTSELDEPSLAKLPGLIDEVKARPGVDVDVIAHTDTFGDAESNRQLSERRAVAVLEFLGQQGIATELMRAIGRGELDPVDNPTDDNYDSPLNRRAEILVK